MGEGRINIDDVKEGTTGKWAGIFAHFGVEVGNGKHRPCPVCGGKDRFRFDNKEGRGTWFCNQCGAGDGWKLLQSVLGVDFVGAVKEVAPVLGVVPECAYVENDCTMTPEYLRHIWEGSTVAHKTNLVGRYLNSRGISHVPTCLRLHMSLKEPDSGEKMPCMLGVVRAVDGEALTMHRTFLDTDGNKANIAKPKKLLPGLKKLTGASIRLSGVPEDGRIGIAEGIETALSCYELLGIPTWAAVNSTMMGAWIPPKGIKSVVVFGDNDENHTGQAAAYSLAHRLMVQYKILTEVEIPETTGDFNDVLRNETLCKRAAMA